MRVWEVGAPEEGGTPLVCGAAVPEADMTMDAMPNGGWRWLGIEGGWLRLEVMRLEWTLAMGFVSARKRDWGR